MVLTGQTSLRKRTDMHRLSQMSSGFRPNCVCGLLAVLTVIMSTWVLAGCTLRGSESAESLPVSTAEPAASASSQQLGSPTVEPTLLESSLDLSTVESTVRAYYTAINEVDASAMAVILDMELDWNKGMVDVFKASAATGLSYQVTGVDVTVVEGGNRRARVRTHYMLAQCVKGQCTEPYDAGEFMELEKRGERWCITRWE